MALITCPECGKENVSDTAVSCPNCGYSVRAHFESQKRASNTERVKRKVSKFWFILAPIAIIALIFLVCTIMYWDNPMKRVRNNPGKLALIMSYGFPEEDSDGIVWRNVSYCGIKGDLHMIDATAWSGFYWYFEYGGKKSKYSDNVEAIEESLEALTKGGERNVLSVSDTLKSVAYVEKNGKRFYVLDEGLVNVAARITFEK